MNFKGYSFWQSQKAFSRISMAQPSLNALHSIQILHRLGGMSKRYSTISSSSQDD
jgi:hypothetical protein